MTEEERSNERDMLKKYGLGFRIASEVVDLEPRMKRWIIKLLQIAYEHGKKSR